MWASPFVERVEEGPWIEGRAGQCRAGRAEVAVAVVRGEAHHDAVARHRDSRRRWRRAARDPAGPRPRGWSGRLRRRRSRRRAGCGRASSFRRTTRSCRPLSGVSQPSTGAPSVVGTAPPNSKKPCRCDDQARCRGDTSGMPSAVTSAPSTGWGTCPARRSAAWGLVPGRQRRRGAREIRRRARGRADSCGPRSRRHALPPLVGPDPRRAGPPQACAQKLNPRTPAGQPGPRRIVANTRNGRAPGRAAAERAARTARQRAGPEHEPRRRPGHGRQR